MAVRIPVVVSQSERRSGSCTEIEEQFITRLLFEAGLDATLVASLQAIDLDSTDHLCIEGLKGDFVIASWEPVDRVGQQLQRLRIPSLEILPLDGGERWAASEGDGPIKRVFYLGLTQAQTVDSMIAALKRLLESKSTPVFSIALGPTPAKRPSSTHSVRVQPIQAPLPETAPTSQKSTQAIIQANEMEETEFPHIDQLVNDLDRFEL